MRTVSMAGQVGGLEPQQQCDSSRRECDSQQCPDRSQEPALDQHLTDQATAGAAQGRPDRELTVPSRSPHEQEVRDIGARDQEDEHDRSEESQENRTHMSRDISGEVLDSKPVTRSSLDRIVDHQVRRDQVHLCLQLLDRRPFAQPPHGPQHDVVSWRVHVVQSSRGPKVDVRGQRRRRRHQQFEPRRHDSDDLRRPPTDFDRPPDNIGGSCVPLLPQGVTQDHDARENARLPRKGSLRVRQPVLLDEISTEHGLDPKHAEEVGGHTADVDLNRIAIPGEGRLERGDTREVLERICAIPKVDEVGGRRREVRYAPIPQLAPEQHEFLGILVGQRLKQDRPHHTKNGGVRSDPQRDRDDRDDGEPAILQQCPRGVLQVLEYRIHAPAPPFVCPPGIRRRRPGFPPALSRFVPTLPDPVS